MQEKLRLQVQYFEGCPHERELRNRVRDAIRRAGTDVSYDELVVGDNETAARVGFRGSPTLLIDGSDFYGDPAPEQPGLSCRHYPAGMPTVDEIAARLESTG
ncbi:MAG: hypothetical protein MAG453_01216 [Calditrichaeota bacterium]|nr:hypothetical protein [Calditrichota bacterium]